MQNNTNNPNSINNPTSKPKLHIAFSICTLAAIFYCYEYYLRVAPSVMSLELKKAYNISDAGLGMLSAYYYYAYMPLQIPVGLLIDKFGARKILTSACLFCVFGTFAFAHANHLMQAQFGRFLIGFGSAFAFVGVLKISNTWLPAKLYAMMVGLCMLLGMFGAMAGEIVMANLVQHIGWQNTLDNAIYCGLILTLLLWFIIRDHPKNIKHPTTKLTSNHPLLPAILKIIKTKQLWYVGLIGCFTFLPLSSFAEMWAVPYLEVIGYKKTQAAFGSSMIFLGFGIGGPLWGILSDFIRSRRLPLIIGSILAGFCALLIILYPNMPKVATYLCLFNCGLFTSVEILVFAVGNDNAHDSISGTTVSFINMVVMFGGIILQPITGILLDLFNQSNSIIPTATLILPYQYALSILPIGLFIASLLSLIAKESHPLANANSYIKKMDPNLIVTESCY